MDSPAPPSAPERRRLAQRLQIWLGLALGLVAIYLVARSFELGALLAALRAVRVPLVVLTLLLSLLSPILKAIRWRWLFFPYRIDLSTLRLAGLVAVGQATNFVIPGRFGELVRTYMTGEESGSNKWYVLGTIAAEKLIDLVVLAMLAVALLPFVALPAALAERVEWFVLTALLVTIGVALLLGARSTWLALAQRMLRILPARTAERWESRLAATLDGLDALRHSRAALAIWGTTLAFWAVAASTNYAMLAAFDLPEAQRPAMALVILAVLQGGVAVPSTPGKIGVFQLLCMVALAAFGVPEAVGFTYGLVMHVVIVGGVTVWAALTLWRRSWNLRRLVDASTSWQ